ncbi:TetR/AcrR family transcriptional regulator [Gemmatimonadota bacterium]
MPPKVVFTREEVIQAAFDIVRIEGLKKLSARKIARKLKSSTAPVYSQFSSMKELELEVLRKAEDLLLQYTRKSFTERVFLNMGTGYVVFAREHSELFRALFLGRDVSSDVFEDFKDYIREDMLKDSRFVTMSAKDRDALLQQMWIFTHGLASLICVGLVEDDSNEHISDTLFEVGTTVVAVALAKSQK